MPDPTQTQILTADQILSQVATLDPMLPALAEAADRLETDPAAWASLWDDARMRAISFVGVPETLSPYPFAAAGFGPECGHALHLALVERLSRGAASAMMALPASAMSTRAVLRLGTEAQAARFFAPFSQGAAWTFFAVTEPEVGSDAAQCSTTLTRNPEGGGWHLSGQKTLIGAATLAERGLVLAREAESGQLRLVMILQGHDGQRFRAERLGMTGLRGAGISHLRFDALPVAEDQILAPDQRRPVMLTLTDVFEKHRPLVGAMALGTARAMLDRLAEAGAGAGSGSQAVADLVLTHEALLRRMIRLGHAAETGPLPVTAVSQFKRQSTALADAVRARTSVLAPDLMRRDARLRRLWRDAGAFEYMEGTSAIHALNAYRDFTTGGLAHDAAL